MIIISGTTCDICHSNLISVLRFTVKKSRVPYMFKGYCQIWLRVSTILVRTTAYCILYIPYVVSFAIAYMFFSVFRVALEWKSWTVFTKLFQGYDHCTIMLFHCIIMIQCICNGVVWLIDELWRSRLTSTTTPIQQM